jgi:hypothetical protein
VLVIDQLPRRLRKTWGTASRSKSSRKRRCVYWPALLELCVDVRALVRGMLEKYTTAMAVRGHSHLACPELTSCRSCIGSFSDVHESNVMNLLSNCRGSVIRESVVVERGQPVLSLAQYFSLKYLLTSVLQCDTVHYQRSIHSIP